jgi:hypothetical protein
MTPPTPAILQILRQPIRAIGVDEIQYAKGHKYLTLVYQIDQGFTRLLWVGKERTIESEHDPLFLSPAI